MLKGLVKGALVSFYQLLAIRSEESETGVNKFIEETKVRSNEFVKKTEIEPVKFVEEADAGAVRHKLE